MGKEPAIALELFLGAYDHHRRVHESVGHIYCAEEYSRLIRERIDYQIQVATAYIVLDKDPEELKKLFEQDFI